MALISDHRQAQTAYEPTLWAKLFHSVPHVNITFHQLPDSRFNPEDDLYLEALGILASVPAAWLIATLVVLLIYLCTRCCDTKSTKRRKSRPLRCCLSFFSLVGVASLAVGFWGNHVLHGGIVGFEQNSAHVDQTIKHAQNIARKCNEILQKDVEQNMNRLYDGPFQMNIRENPSTRFEIMDHADVIFHNITEGLNAMDKLRFAIDPDDPDYPDNRIDFRRIPHLAQRVENYRWPATMTLQSLFAIFCLLLFVGAIVHSRCVLILFSVFGLFSIIFLWLLASIYLTGAVALADLCYDPTPWVKHAIRRKVGADVSSYFLECHKGLQSPFEQALSASQRAIKDIDIHVSKLSGSSRQLYSSSDLDPYLDDLERSTQETLQLVDNLAHSLKCQAIFRSYNTALVSLCDNGLLGLIAMLFSCALSGILFTLLVWCNSHTWIYFKHKPRYVKVRVDDADPYMPLSTIERPRGGPGGPSSTLLGVSGPGSAMGISSTYSHHHHRRTMHTPPQTPPYHGTLNGHGTLGVGGGAPQNPVTSSRSPYGHLTGGGGVGTSAPHHSRLMGAGTLGRHAHPQQFQRHQPSYQGMDNLPATMTLGRRGHYAAARGSHRLGHDADDHGGAASGPLLGVGSSSGQYATLNKQCKTLESSDFY